MWHPIRLAEDYAQADIMTGGRVIMGVGRGYHTREVETFGAPMLDNKANQELFEEQMEVLLKCFNEESWAFKGKHYTIPAPVEYRGYQLTDITVVPRPIHVPVEIWQPIASGKTLPYIAQRGIKGMVTLSGERIFDQVVRARRALSRRARQVVRALRLRALRGRGGPLVGHAGRARARAEYSRGRGAEGLALRAARARDRADPRVRGTISRARAHDDPLGRRHAAQGIQGAALMVCPRRDARLRRPLAGRR